MSCLIFSTSATPAEAPQFVRLYTILIVIGALIVLIPKAPLTGSSRIISHA